MTDDQDEVGADLPATAHDGAASRAPDLSLPAAWLGGGPSEPGLVCGLKLPRFRGVVVGWVITVLR